MSDFKETYNAVMLLPCVRRIVNKNKKLRKENKSLRNLIQSLPEFRQQPYCCANYDQYVSNNPIKIKKEPIDTVSIDSSVNDIKIKKEPIDTVSIDSFESDVKIIRPITEQPENIVYDILEETSVYTEEVEEESVDGEGDVNDWYFGKEKEDETIKLCKNIDCERYPPDWDFEEDTEETYQAGQWQKCCLCDGYFDDDGSGDILYVQEEPNNQKAGCSLCGKSEDIVQMKGTGQYLCGNACDEEEEEDVEVEVEESGEEEEEEEEEDPEAEDSDSGESSYDDTQIRMAVLKSKKLDKDCLLGRLLGKSDMSDDKEEEEEEKEKEKEKEEEEEEESAEEEEVEESAEEEEEVEESAEEEEEEEEEEVEESAEEEEEEEEEESAEEEEVEESAEEEEEVEESAEEEEELEVFEITINGTEYYTTNENDGVIYAVDADSDVGDEIGKFVNKKPVFY